MVLNAFEALKRAGSENIYTNMDNTHFAPMHQRKSKAGAILAMIGIVALIGAVCYVAF